jgi:hypothetical protein
MFRQKFSPPHLQTPNLFNVFSHSQSLTINCQAFFLIPSISTIEVIKTIQKIHHYEGPLINIFPLVNHLFEMSKNENK